MYLQVSKSFLKNYEVHDLYQMEIDLQRIDEQRRLQVDSSDESDESQYQSTDDELPENHAEKNAKRIRLDDGLDDSDKNYTSDDDFPANHAENKSANKSKRRPLQEYMHFGLEKALLCKSLG